MWPWVEHPGAAGVGHHRQRRAEQHQRRGDQNGEGDHFHFPDIDFLPEVLRGAADHQPGDKYRQHNEQQHAVQARADAAEYHFANLHQPHRHHAAQRGEGVMHGIDRAAGGGGGDHREQTAGENTEATLFSFHIQAAVGTQRQQMRIAAGLRPHHHGDAEDKDQRHCPQDGASLTPIAYHLAEGEAQRRRDQEDRQHLHEIGQRGRVFKRMGGVGIEETAAVSAQQLNRFL